MTDNLENEYVISAIDERSKQRIQRTVATLAAAEQLVSDLRASGLTIVTVTRNKLPTPAREKGEPL